MNVSLVNLCLRSQRAATRVERGLVGARPRSLKKRFRRLLRPSLDKFFELRSGPNENDPPVRVRVTESHLSAVGRLRIEKFQALEKAAKAVVEEHTRQRRVVAL